jgi:AraC-like DNA-binding protein
MEQNHPTDPQRAPDVVPIPALRFDSRAIGRAGEPAEAFELWRTILGEFYDVGTPPLPETEFTADITTWNLAGVLFGQGMFTGQRFTRTAERARRDGFDPYTIVLYRQGGWRADAGGRPMLSAPGRVSLMDFARPVSADVTTNDSISVTIPRDFLDSTLAPRDLHGLVLGGATGGILHDFMVALGNRIAGLSAGEAPYLAAALRDLLAACVEPSPAACERARPAIDAVAYRRAEALIEANLHKVDWNAEQLRLALGVSRSTLYRLFEPAGGVAAHIRSHRLARAHAMLTSSHGSTRVYQVAEMCGFASETHFSRAFRQVFGYTAREAIGIRGASLQAARRLTPARRGEDAAFVRWIRQLRR